VYEHLVCLLCRLAVANNFCAILLLFYVPIRIVIVHFRPVFKLKLLFFLFYGLPVLPWYRKVTLRNNFASDVASAVSSSSQASRPLSSAFCALIPRTSPSAGGARLHGRCRLPKTSVHVLNRTRSSRFQNSPGRYQRQRWKR